MRIQLGMKNKVSVLGLLRESAYALDQPHKIWLLKNVTREAITLRLIDEISMLLRAATQDAIGPQRHGFLL
jgi:hypothetical protein